jgi:Kdo2-lipid IVA lauroyltransferase/acyltransferase
LEYLAVRAVAGLIQCLPYRVALGLGWGIAGLIFYVFRYRAAAAKTRIREVFGTRYSNREVNRIAWQSWRNFCWTAVEMVRIPVSSPAWVRSVVDVGDSDRKILAHMQTGRGAIIAAAHMGSWEMATLTSLACGIRLFTVTGNQKNQLVEEYIHRMRMGTGFETLQRSSSVLKGIVRKIREGKVFALLPDVRSRTPGVAIRFLGKTANIAGGLGLIAKMTGVPVFPCVITRQGCARHRYRLMEAVWPDANLEKTEDWRRMTQAVFDVFDRAIREQPEQWFWFNKRWILDPLEPTADGGTPDDGRQTTDARHQP